MYCTRLQLAWGANAMEFALRAVLLCASIILAASRASAGTVTVTYTGTFCVSCASIGIVNTGSIEGVNAADLAGKSISGTLSFNTSGFINDPGYTQHFDTFRGAGGGSTGTINQTTNIGGHLFSDDGTAMSYMQLAIPSQAGYQELSFVINGNGLYDTLYTTVPTASYYSDPSNLDSISFVGMQANLILDYAGGPGVPGAEWTFPVTISATDTPTPIPAALPLFATGIGVLGLLGWRRKRKAASGPS
jgi:hypothetical protein